MALRHTHLPDAGAVTSPPWALSLLRLQNPILTVFYQMQFIFFFKASRQKKEKKKRKKRKNFFFFNENLIPVQFIFCLVFLIASSTREKKEKPFPARKQSNTQND